MKKETLKQRYKTVGYAFALTLPIAHALILLCKIAYPLDDIPTYIRLLGSLSGFCLYFTADKFITLLKKKL